MPASLTPGIFLIASLGLEEDPNFGRAVVLILQHSAEDGTFGLVVNRPLGDRVALYANQQLQHLAEGLDLDEGGADSLFYQGGPVQPGYLLFLHRLDDLDDEERGTQVCTGLFVGGNLDAIRGRTGVAASTQPLLRFYLGYAGWAAGQLEAEIAMDSWVLSPATADLVFSRHPESVWQQALYGLGGRYRSLSFLPEDPIVN
jgi:putative transcriptional regulator